MLKFFTTTNLIHQSKTKCGEIYCHSYLDFTIYCTFCDIKLFAYDDFLLHLKNVHFDNNLLTTESSEKNKELFQSNEMENTIDEIINFSDNDFDNIMDTTYRSSEEEAPLLVIKESEKDILKKGKTKIVCRINTKEECNSSNPSSSSNNDNTVKKTKFTEMFSCPECKEQFSYKKYLDIHVYELHNGYKCTLCDKRFRLRHHLKRHILLHTAKKKFACTREYCDRSFSNEEYLKRHLEVHTTEKPFICQFENCGRAFQTERRLLTHHYNHSRPKKLICDACGYRCRAIMTLRIHQRIHTGEKPFTCEVCQKCFISKTALNIHMITHSETRPHVCKICNATFANYRILQRHVFIHSDERKFKCKICNKSFKQVHGLDGHMRRIHRPPKLSVITNN